MNPPSCLFRGLALAAVLSVLAVPAPAQVLSNNPTFVGAARSDLDLGGHAVVNGSFGGTAGQKGSSKEVWIAVRTDGRGGDGSRENPYDGSTRAKFDGLMQGFGARTVIHLLPGTYLTNGWADATGLNGWVVKSGWKLSGAGMGATTVKLAAATTTGGIQAYVIASGFNTLTDCVEVSDLTVDCNGSLGTGAYASYAFDAVYLTGNHCRIERVEVVHEYAKDGQKEGFPLCISNFDAPGPHAGTVDGTIAHCVVRSFVGSSANRTCISIGATTASIAVGSNSTGVIAGNLVQDCPGHAYGSAGGVLIQGNTALNCGVGWYGEVGPVSDVSISGNYFQTSLAGVQLFAHTAAAAFGNIVVSGNVLQTTATSGQAWGVLLQNAGDSGMTLSGVRIADNVHRYTGSGAAVTFLGVDPSWSGVSVDGNISTCAMGGVLSASSSVGDNVFAGSPSSNLFHLSGANTATGESFFTNFLHAGTQGAGRVSLYPGFGGGNPNAVGITWEGGGNYPNQNEFALANYGFEGGTLDPSSLFFESSLAANADNWSTAARLDFAHKRLRVGDGAAPGYTLDVAGDAKVAGRIHLGAVDLISGTGSPEGAVAAPAGSTFQRSDGGASTSFYVKESGAGNTGWVAK